MTRYLIVLILIILVGSLFSQDEENKSYLEYSRDIVLEDVNQAFHLGLGFIQAPFEFNSQDWLYIGGASAATSTLFLIDPQIKDFAQSNQTTATDKIFEIDSYFNNRTGSYAGAGLYLSGFIFKEEKIRKMGLHALETLFLANGLTSFFKYSFGRRRPYGGADHMRFKAFRGSKGKYRAFPSGHTTSAFAFGSVMAMSVDNIYWKSFWYGSAGMVGLARIYHNVHWISDTFFAAIISYNVADYVVHFDSEDDDEGLKIYPSFNGLAIQIYF